MKLAVQACSDQLRKSSIRKSWIKFANRVTMFCLKVQQISKTLQSLSQQAVKCANFSYGFVQAASWHTKGVVFK